VKALFFFIKEKKEGKKKKMKFTFVAENLVLLFKQLKDGRKS